MTEKEIFNGILRAKNVENNVLFFEREIEDIEKHIESNTTLARRFIDLDKTNKVDVEAKRFLDDLKWTKIPSKLSAANTFKFKVKWCNETGISMSSHASYIEKFGETFYAECKRLIDRNQASVRQMFENTMDEREIALASEVMDHARFCNETAEKFHGRQDFLSKVFDSFI